MPFWKLEKSEMTNTKMPRTGQPKKNQVDTYLEALKISLMYLTGKEGQFFSLSFS